MQSHRISIDDMQRNERWLRRLAYDLTRDAGAADDLVQDTFVEVLRKPPDSNGAETPLPVRAYLGGVLRNLYKMQVRASVRRERREAFSLDDQGDFHPDAAMDEQAVVSALMEEVDKLSEPFRTTLLLRYYEGLQSNEIATRLGVPPATVRKRNQLALDRLRNRLDTRTDGDQSAWLRAVSRLAAPAIPGAWANTLVASRILRQTAIVCTLAAGFAIVLHWSPFRFPRGAGASVLSNAEGASAGLLKLTSLPAWRENRDSLSSPEEPASEPSEATNATSNGIEASALQNAIAEGSDDSAVATHQKSCGSIQTRIENAPPGSTIVLPAGCIFREKALVMNPITIVGAPGTEIRGSDVWTAFSPSTTGAQSTWASAQAVPELPDERRDCAKRSLGPCVGPERVYRDGVALERVAIGSIVQPNQFALTRDRHVVLGANPTEHEIEVTTRLGWMSVAAHDVFLEKLHMRHAASPEYGFAVINPSERVSIRNSEFSDTAGTCVSLAGINHTFENNRVHDCGFEALRLEPGRNALVENNELSNSGSDREHIEWMPGGINVILHLNARLSRNRIFKNHGVGVINIRGNGLAVVDNNIHDNAAAGITFLQVEGGLIKGNRVWSNAAHTQPPEPALFLASAKHVEVTDNTFAYHPFAVYIGPRRGQLPAGFEPCNDTTDNLVHQNVLIANGRKWAGIVNSGDPREQATLRPCSTNRFEDNRFWPVADRSSSQLLSLADKDRWLGQKSIPLK
jgi:RNA polymerase sigma factor (sigma-70 family)